MNKQTLSILVVDDDQITRFIHRRVVESIQHLSITYYEAINGLDAITQLEKLNLAGQKLPDLILLDINMPVLDGFGFIEAFQKAELQKKEDTEIVIVSSSENCNDIKRCYELGINRFASKPIAMDKLVSLLQSKLLPAAA